MDLAAPALVVSLRDVDLRSVAEVGGKNASLGEMLRTLGETGVRVPDGFALTSAAYRLHLAEAGILRGIEDALHGLDVRDVKALDRAGRKVREMIRSSRLPRAVEDAALAAYRELSRSSGEEETDVAVRSSATAEDMPDASYAGQHDTYLDVHGKIAVLQSIRDCMASLFTDRAIVYRAERGIDHRQLALSVGVQKMVRSESSGVIFTLDTETGNPDVVVITSSWGLGETVAQGRVDPDEIWVHKPTLAAGFRPIIRRDLGDKALEMIRAPGGGTREVRVPMERRRRFSIRDEEMLELARWAVKVEEHYGRRAGRATPMDIEWAKDGPSGLLYLVQARPETVQSRAAPTFELYRMTGKGKVVARGKSVGGKVGGGVARVVHAPEGLADFRPGEVLVAEMTDPDWEPVMKGAAGIVTDRGGRTCHAAIVSRELGVPCVVGTGNGTRAIGSATEVTVSCAEGDEGRVYQGRVPFVRETIDPAALPRPKVPVMLNVGNPGSAFLQGRLPSAGVGLARLEFVISGWIGIHPMALVHPERVKDGRVMAEIRARTAGSRSMPDFFVERLSLALAQLAAAFHPRPVIARFSDFKTNEYANLLGGVDFEPVEANPMIGFRGASRYYDDRYREAFALECAAVRRVRSEMGLTNLRVMIPFCRTLGEARSVLTEMEKNGLVRGKDGFEVWVMCEIPNNVVLAAEFAELFDGFSIGSNDLTQLTLGVDRDSADLAGIFDEQDPGVMRLIAEVTRVAHQKGRKVGLCGQAPSDHPEFARYLADVGLDSISVTADALPRVVEILAS